MVHSLAKWKRQTWVASVSARVKHLHPHEGTASGRGIVSAPFTPSRRPVGLGEGDAGRAPGSGLSAETVHCSIWAAIKATERAVCAEHDPDPSCRRIFSSCTVKKATRYPNLDAKGRERAIAKLSGLPHRYRWRPLPRRTPRRASPGLRRLEQRERAQAGGSER